MKRYEETRTERFCSWAPIICCFVASAVLLVVALVAGIRSLW